MRTIFGVLMRWYNDGCLKCGGLKVRQGYTGSRTCTNCSSYWRSS